MYGGSRVVWIGVILGSWNILFMLPGLRTLLSFDVLSRSIYIDALVPCKLSNECVRVAEYCCLRH